MKKGFDAAFDDLMLERMGAEIARLRERNERYKLALNEHSELINAAQRKEIDDYKKAFERLAELSTLIRDLENRCLFYAGMATHKKMDDAISSFGIDEITE